MRKGTDELIWKALADPTRRGILDVLSEEAKTTGDLCSTFSSLGRTGVMKHLDVLVDAGLVLVRREGRLRWNHPNPMPLQRVYERWMKRHVVSRARVLSALGDAAERRTVSRNEVKQEAGFEGGAMNREAVESRTIELELVIEASPATTWMTLVEDIGRWWPADYRAVNEAAAFHFDARPGGSVWEESADGGGLQWFSVQALEIGRWVSLVGFTAPPWGGPFATTLRLELRAGDSGGTVLQLTDASFGRLGSATEIEEGWRAIFAGLQEAARARNLDS